MLVKIVWNEDEIKTGLKSYFFLIRLSDISIANLIIAPR